MSERANTKPADVIGQLTSIVAQRRPSKSIPIPPRPTPTPSTAVPLDDPDIDLVEVVPAPRREGMPPRPRPKAEGPSDAPSDKTPEAAALRSAPAPTVNGRTTTTPSEGAASPAGIPRLVLLSRDQIITLPDQPRTSENTKVRLGDLATSIAQIGLRVPLQGKWDAVTGKYQLFDGHRRLLALDQLIPRRPDLGKNIPMLVLGDEELEAWRALDEHERMFLLSFVVNTVREDINKADRGRAYETLIAKFGVGGTAQLLGITTRSVQRHMSAAKNADQHIKSGETLGQPAWLPKYWVRMARSQVKLAADRFEPSQREAASKWLRSVARAVERGEAKLPPFPTGVGGAVPSDAE